MLRKFALFSIILSTLSGQVMASNSNHNSNNDGPEDDKPRQAAAQPRQMPAEQAQVMRQIGRGITPILQEMQRARTTEERQAAERKLKAMVEAQQPNLNLLGKLVSGTPAEPPAPTQPPATVPATMSLADYLKTTAAPRLMIGCGHDSVIAQGRLVKIPHPIEVLIKGKRYQALDKHRHKKDLLFEGDYHHHKGWFTLDSDDISSPDCSGDVMDAEVLTALLPADTFQLVMEELAEEHLYTNALFAAIARSLKKGGAFVANLPFNSVTVDGQSCMQLLDPENLGEFWKSALPEATKYQVSKERKNLEVQLARAQKQLRDVSGQKRVVTAKKQHLNNLIRGLERDLGNNQKHMKYMLKHGFLRGAAELRAKISPLLQSLGFSKVEIHESLTAVFLQLRVMGALQNAPHHHLVQIGDKRTTIGDLIKSGPHPEASALDPYFKDKPLSMFYLIARK
jgi:hypothetical protein